VLLKNNTLISNGGKDVMNILKTTGYAICIVVLLAIFAGMIIQPVALALPKDTAGNTIAAPAEGEPKPEVKISCKYPILSSPTASGYEFECDFSYFGGDLPKIFDVKVKVPNGFTFAVARSYGGGSSTIAAIQLDPMKAYTPETLKISVSPYMWIAPPPGDYPITVQAVSGNITGSIELKAVVTAKYALGVSTATGLMNTQVTAGQDNFFSFTLKNTGTAQLDKINFSSKLRGGPSGWNITFDPKNIDSLPVDAEREVKVNIKPPEKTIAGDYEMTVTAETDAKNASDNMNIRITALTPTIWGWVGVIIVVLVVAGLIYMFLRLGRR
jgi:hypothetical protein